jgi:hypothetical protein
LVVHVNVAEDPGRTLPAAGLITASETFAARLAAFL